MFKVKYHGRSYIHVTKLKDSRIPQYRQKIAASEDGTKLTVAAPLRGSWVPRRNYELGSVQIHRTSFLINFLENYFFRFNRSGHVADVNFL